MASQYRHRRTSNPATAFPNPLEPGEIAVNTANRQIAVGDAAAGVVGAPLPLLAIRYFDARAQYAANEMVVQGGLIQRAIGTVAPGAFNATQWRSISGDVMTDALKVEGASAQLSLNKASAAGFNLINAYTNNSLRWQMQLGNSAAEGGANAGSDFALARIADDGSTVLGYPLFIKRSNGNVGVNQPNPVTARFEVGGGILASGASAMLALTDRVGAGRQYTWYDPDGNGLQLDLPTIGTALMVKTANGFVGIGTSSPGVVAPAAGSRTLTINGSTQSGSLGLLELNSDAVAAGMGCGAVIYTARNAVSQASKAIGQINVNLAASGTSGNYGGVMTFYTKTDNGGLQPRLTISDGISVFQGDLYTYRPAASTTGVLFMNSAGSQYIYQDGTYFQFTQSIRTTATIRVGDAPDDRYNSFGGDTGFGSMLNMLWERTGGYYGITVRDNTTGGIGTYLHMIRDDGAQLGYIVGTGPSLQYYSASGADIKERVRPAREVVDCLEKVRAIKVRHFKWKGFDKESVGLIAEELHELFGTEGDIVLPPHDDIRYERDEDDKIVEHKGQSAWAVSYQSLVPYMLGAMQQVADEIDALKGTRQRSKR